MQPTVERIAEFVNQGGSYALPIADLRVFEFGAGSRQPGPGGTNFHNVYQFQADGVSVDPNGKVYVPNTEVAFCLDATRQKAWKKIDGKISNTGWTEITFFVL